MTWHRIEAGHYRLLDVPNVEAIEVKRVEYPIGKGVYWSVFIGGRRPRTARLRTHLATAKKDAEGWATNGWSGSDL